MLVVETVAKIGRLHFVQVMPTKAICRELGLSRKVVRKVLRSGATELRYMRTRQPLLRLGPWQGELDELLAANEARPSREWLTLMRIFEALRRLGYEGGYDRFRRCARAWWQRPSSSSCTMSIAATCGSSTKSAMSWTGLQGTFAASMPDMTAPQPEGAVPDRSGPRLLHFYPRAWDPRDRVLGVKPPLTLHLGISLVRHLARSHDALGAIQREADRTPVLGGLLYAWRGPLRAKKRTPPIDIPACPPLVAAQGNACLPRATSQDAPPRRPNKREVFLWHSGLMVSIRTRAAVLHSSPGTQPVALSASQAATAAADSMMSAAASARPSNTPSSSK